MLTASDNEILTRVGPGTYMGDLMRQYWIPALISDELPSPDCPPLRLRLLGENLISFRTTSGAVGITVNSCPHRGASMFFGRNEEEGLRCVYHGWKFDTTGACVDMPSEPAESNFKNKVRIKAYKTHEANGMIWVYMGPRETPPPLPEVEGALAAQGNNFIRKWVRECNYMQPLEGDIDTIHAGFLHYGHVDAENLMHGSCYYYTLKEKVAAFDVIQTDIGATYGAHRKAEEDTEYWRIAHFLMPFYTMNPTGLLGTRVSIHAWVPIDDEYTMDWVIAEPGSNDPNERGIGGLLRGPSSLRGQRTDDAMKPMEPLNAGTLPQTSDWNGRFRPAANVQNDWLIDRNVQKTMSTYSGIPSDAQDPMAQESMGLIYDRTQEHLGITDSMIIRTRRRLIDAAKAFRATGEVPPGVDQPSLYRMRAGGALLPNGVNGLEATKDVIYAQAEAIAALT
jgi:phthalate 4,5-dioxygenase oxygenase subunit